MTFVQVAAVRFGYGADVLFEDVSFALAAGERLALVAPNGAGKSSLLRLVAGEATPDAGQVVRRGAPTVGVYRQSHEHAAEGDVLAAFLSGFHEVVAARDALRVAETRAASGAEDDLARLAAAQDRYQLVEGDRLEQRVTAIAEKLGFAAAHLARPVASLSGGERGRLALGTVLAREPDVLLLDEPTNHLDLDTIRWLEGHLQSFRGALLVVSHDRAFLDATTNRTFELGRRGGRLYPVPYSRYVEARAEELARERKLVDEQRAFVAKTEDFIRRNLAGQKTKQAQSRRKMLDKLERIEGPEDVWSVAERVAFRFQDVPRSGDVVLDAKALSARRGERVLFEGLDLLVRRGERLGIVGPNGAGKSTLLRLLAGAGDPALDAGTVRRGTNLHEGTFDQHLGGVDPRRTAVEEVRAVRGDLNVDGARQYLARFRFWGDDPLRRVAGFSGGERARLALAKLLLEPRNLLFLDEPTNHLDIPAAEILEEALRGFEGTVVLVSHDRRFLEAITTRLVEVRGGRAVVHSGGYADFARAPAAGAKVPRPASLPPPKGSARTSAPPRRPDVAAPARASSSASSSAATSARAKARLADVVGFLARDEAKLEVLRGRLREPPGGDWAAFDALVAEERALATRVAKLVDERRRLEKETAR